MDSVILKNYFGLLGDILRNKHIDEEDGCLERIWKRCKNHLTPYWKEQLNNNFGVFWIIQISPILFNEKLSKVNN